MNFNGHYLIKNNISISKKVINLYISYTLVLQSRHLNADLDKYYYTGYGIGFDSRSEFLFTDRSYGKKSFFGADMSPCMHVNNNGKKIS